VTQIPDKDFAYILWKRESLLSIALSTYDKFTYFPIDVIQRHMNHIPGTQTEPCQQEQNYIITLAYKAILVAAL
jgi:hypothetical protein